MSRSLSKPGLPVVMALSLLAPRAWAQSSGWLGPYPGPPPGALGPGPVAPSPTPAGTPGPWNDWGKAPRPLRAPVSGQGLAGQELARLRTPLNLSVKDQPLGKVLTTLEVLCKLQVEIPEELAGMKVNASGHRMNLAQCLEVLSCAAGAEIRLEGRTLRVRKGWQPRLRSEPVFPLELPVTMTVRQQPVARVVETLAALARRTACVSPQLAARRVDLDLRDRKVHEVLAELGSLVGGEGFVDGAFLRLQPRRAPGDQGDPLAWSRGTDLLWPAAPAGLDDLDDDLGFPGEPGDLPPLPPPPPDLEPDDDFGGLE